MNKKWDRYNLWRVARDFCNKQMKKAWMSGGNCDSCCPKCFQWESHGNRIITLDNVDGSNTRICGNCGHTWKAIFTPVGFAPVEDKQLDSTKPVYIEIDTMTSTSNYKE